MYGRRGRGQTCGSRDNGYVPHQWREQFRAFLRRRSLAELAAASVQPASGHNVRWQKGAQVVERVFR